jgi:hypothetical protein
MVRSRDNTADKFTREQEHPHSMEGLSAEFVEGCRALTNEVKGGGGIETPGRLPESPQEIPSIRSKQ